jgi:pentatricopeptide repeat protein
LAGLAGWLALTKGLFRQGLNDEAFQHLQKGLQEGWNPDASLYEYVLRAFCGADNVEQALRVLASMPDLGVPPRTLHYNILVEAIARTSGTPCQSAACLQTRGTLMPRVLALRLLLLDTQPPHVLHEVLALRDLFVQASKQRWRLSAERFLRMLKSSPPLEWRLRPGQFPTVTPSAASSVASLTPPGQKSSPGRLRTGTVQSPTP